MMRYQSWWLSYSHWCWWCCIRTTCVCVCVSLLFCICQTFTMKLEFGSHIERQHAHTFTYIKYEYSVWDHVANWRWRASMWEHQTKTTVPEILLACSACDGTSSVCIWLKYYKLKSLRAFFFAFFSTLSLFYFRKSFRLSCHISHLAGGRMRSRAHHKIYFKPNYIQSTRVCCV